MSHPPVPSESTACQNQPGAHQRVNGFIVFCETNLRYEKGYRAWIFLGPYLLGALGLEMVMPRLANAAPSLAPWIGFLAYLVFFPLVWHRILSFISIKKATPVVSSP